MNLVTGLGSLAAIALVFFFRERNKRRSRRAEAEHVQLLSESRCSQCARVYGLHTALQAFYGGELPDRSRPFSAEWWRELKPVHYGRSRVISCPDCGTRQRYSLRCQALFSLIPSEPKPFVLSESIWNETLCTHCGARKRHWADHKNWRCARCHEPLGEAPDESESDS